MFAYIIRRLFTVIPVVVGVMLLTFVLFRTVGGNPANRIVGKGAGAERIAAVTHLYGYDKPLVLGFYANEMTQEGAVKGIFTTKEKDSETKIHKFQPPDGGSLTLPLSVLDPDYEQQYRLQFRIVAPHGGTVRIHREFKGVSDTAKVKLHEETVPPSPSQKLIAATLISPKMEKSPTEITEESVPTKLEVIFHIEFEGKEATVYPARFFGIKDHEHYVFRRQRHPFDAQLWRVMWDLLRFDFGESKETRQRVSTMLLNGIGPSLTITVPAFFLNLFVTISVALVCAYYRNSILDRTLVVLAVIGMSINIVILCILVQTLAGTDAKFLGVPIGLQNYGFPVWGFEGPRYLILPLLIGLITGVGGGVRFYRTVMLNERYSDYVRTAQAKGASEPAIMFKHVLKNAMIPILTNVVIAIPFLYTGALLLENFFGIPGIGFLTVQAINNGDEAVLFASVYLGAILFVIANLLTDISYAIADPRVRLK